MLPQAMSTDNGIGQVVAAYRRHLPDFGIEFVDSPEQADLIAAHAGAGAPVDVAHCHGLYWTADGNSERWEWIANAGVITSLRSALEITVPSNWVAETIRRDLRVNPAVIGHGIDITEWPVGESQGYVLWNKNRQTDACDPAPLDELARRLPGTRFVSTYGMPASNVKLTGRLSYEAMREVVRGAGVYLATAKETFGIGTLEAMAAGVPILGWNWGGTADIVVHGETGYLADPWNYNDLQEGLAYCLANRDRLGTAGREHATRYTWSAVAEQVAAVYRRAYEIKTAPAACAVVIPCHNYGDVVGRAIASALKQTHTVAEVIVVDDGSTDNTAAAVEEWVAKSDGRVRFIRKQRGGVATARNAGIAATSAKYVCCLDADDAVAPNFIHVCVSALERQPDLGIAYTGLLAVAADGTSKPSDWPGQCDPDKQFAGQNQVPTCAVFRRRIWERLGGIRQRYAPQGAGSEDAEFWLRAMAYGFKASKVHDGGLFIYSIGTGMVSSGRWKGAPWTTWHPWTRDKQYPFAALATPINNVASHPVRYYDQPLISVVIPVGPGHQDYLIDALDSLEAQTFRNWEAIVINDSGAPLDLTAYPYVKSIELAGKSGAGKARNAGAAVARAPWLVFLDADDYLQPAFMALALKTARDERVTWVYTDCEILHPDKAPEIYPAFDFDPEKLHHSGIAGVTCLHATADWRAVGGFDEESGREDWDFHLRLASRGICAARVAQPLWTYRHSSGTRRNAPGLREEAQAIYRRFNLEEIKMACAPCAKKSKAIAEAAIAAAQAQALPQRRALEAAGSAVSAEQPQTVIIEYVGKNRADVIYAGSAGGRYAFGDNETNRRKAVRIEDAPQLLRLSVFRVAQVVQPVQRASDTQAPMLRSLP